jgi:hypothetical protein
MPVLHKLGTTKQNHAIFYSRPGVLKERKATADHIREWVRELEAQYEFPWILLIDGRGLEAQHCPSLPILKDLIEMLQTRFQPHIAHIFVLYPNWKFSTMLTLANPFLSSTFKKKLHVLDQDPTVALLELSSQGVDVKTVRDVILSK